MVSCRSHHNIVYISDYNLPVSLVNIFYSILVCTNQVTVHSGVIYIHWYMSVLSTLWFVCMVT